METSGAVIYVLSDGGTLTEVRQRGYLSDDARQALLADYPGLLAGDHVRADAGRAGIPCIVVRSARGLPDLEPDVGGRPGPTASRPPRSRH